MLPQWEARPLSCLAGWGRAGGLQPAGAGHDRGGREGGPVPASFPALQLPVTSFAVHSTIVSRYASTWVRCTLRNPHASPREATFDLDLPAAAFVSNFTITANGKAYVAEVKEKQQAQKLYEEARQRGKTAAHVGTRERETERFRVSASVAAGSTVAFELRYEELLQRRLGHYQHAVSVRPGQVVPGLSVELSIAERAGLGFVRVLPLRTSRLLTNALQGEAAPPPSASVEKGTHCAWVRFAPSPEEQAAFSSAGIAGDFVVQYDVARQDIAGDVQMYDGYFVHFFAPGGLPPIQKEIVFVIDVSGSMTGTKMKQTKVAMRAILRELRAHDCFNIVAFSEGISVWQADGSVPATAPHVHSATRFVDSLQAEGWTDINRALLTAASVLNRSRATEPGHGRIPLLVFLTDGEATAGVTAGARILANTRRALASAVSLFGLAFGADADYGLLRRLALENRGAARRIYEDADAALQLAGFYEEIGSPLLHDVQLSYPGQAAHHLTRSLFPNYFQGSELVVAGQVPPGAARLRVRATGRGQEGQLHLGGETAANATELPPSCALPPMLIGAFVRRLWAYFTIQDLLRARFHANNTDARRLLAAQATNLSLEYHFVTPVTSLVVVTPEEEEGPTATPSTESGTATATLGSVTAPWPATTVPASQPEAMGTAGEELAWLGTAGTVAPALGSMLPGPCKGPGDAMLLLPPDKAELLAPGDGDTQFVESLDPPAVYTILPVAGEAGAPSPCGWDTQDPVTLYLGSPGLLSPYSQDASDPITPWLGPSGPHLLSPGGSQGGGPSTPLTPSDAPPAADGDPHFIARPPGVAQTLCFTLDGRPGDIVRLVTDPRRGEMDAHGPVPTAAPVPVPLPECLMGAGPLPPAGLVVNGRLVGAPPWPAAPRRPRTFFDAFAVVLARPGAPATTVTITLWGVTIGGEPPLALPFSHPAQLARPPLALAVGPGGHLRLRLGPRLAAVVLRHRYGRPSALQRDHLGFYVTDGRGLSPDAGGLLGECHHCSPHPWRGRDAHTRCGVGDLVPGPPAAWLRGDGAAVPATLVTKALRGPRGLARPAPCWLVKRPNVAALLGAPYAAFLAPHLLSA
ncbi:LOW QUALITY PROTEIN: inter-alpha-trypsin inhibitor heavy chain H6 [Apteryx rowi]|uniref:LOW QUALITY PROTEIN: inter-alpha-trypsin inhibitor heavy chain H6 n=1 Tax=Apteryx rowi TaxID=308060 RepID=UPI000E1CE7CF|nr:LOW QUALITY PROTEIN: inter-alpha-trypsin inhibitor heavy chain H6 [Apteryx rowi]